MWHSLDLYLYSRYSVVKETCAVYATVLNRLNKQIPRIRVRNIERDGGREGPDYI